MILDEEMYIEHFGVAGMRWGVRKGKSKTGISRSQGALLDRNERKIHALEQAKLGKKWRATAAIGRLFVSKKSQQASWNRQIKTLTAQNERVIEGRAHKYDRQQAHLNVSIAGLLISSRPKEFVA